MKILLSCVNSVVSFVGYDLAAEQPFWYCPSDRVRACGAAYDGDALLVATDNQVTRLSASGALTRFSMPGPHKNLLHSVHPLEGTGIGVIDTGNSRLLVFADLSDGGNARASVSFEPLEGWENVPQDAIHLNDFAATPRGLVASCFNYRPYRILSVPERPWQKMDYGLLLSLEKHSGRNVGRVLAGGLSCPHSLVWHGDSLYCCASATGEFIRFSFNARGMLVEQETRHVTDAHFLRGALPLGDGSWILGGSHIRHVEGSGMALYRLEVDGNITALPVAAAGEIYDILPWRDEIMRPVAGLMASLPPDFADEDNIYPPVCHLE